MKKSSKLPVATATVRKMRLSQVKYNQEAIKLCEDMLAKAKDGELIEVVLMYRSKQGGWHHHATGTDDLHLVIGRLYSVLHSQMIRLFTSD